MINPQEYVNKAYELGEKVYGNRLIFAAHYGSFNYGLADEESDCDVALIVMPSMEEIVRCASSDVLLKHASKGNIDVIDVRTFVRWLVEANLNSLQYLYAPYHKWNEYWDDIFASLRGDFLWDIAMISPYELFYNMRGVISRAKRRMDNVSEKNPFNLSCSKAVYNAMRMINLASSFADDIKDNGLATHNSHNLFSWEYGIHNRQDLMVMKRGLCSYTAARSYIDSCMKEIDEFHDIFNDKNNEIIVQDNHTAQRLERMIEGALANLYFNETAIPKFWS